MCNPAKCSRFAVITLDAEFCDVIEVKMFKDCDPAYIYMYGKAYELESNKDKHTVVHIDNVFNRKMLDNDCINLVMTVLQLSEY